MKSGLQAALRHWVEFVVSNARAVMLVASLLAMAAIALAATKLSVDTDPANMLSAELSWRKAEKALDAAFPNTDGGLVVVLDGSNAGRTAQAQAALYEALLPQSQYFTAVHAAEMEPYFRRNGLLYLDSTQLEEFASGILKVQPFLGALARDPSLTGVSNLLSQALQAPDSGFDLAPALTAFATAVDAAAVGKSAPLDWSTLMANPSAVLQGSNKFIEVSPVLNFSKLQPAAAPIKAIRTAIAELKGKGFPDVRVRITGSKALEHEEIGMAFSGALLAFGVALLLAAMLLKLALRSGRLVAITVITLLFGLIFTAGFAALAVGKLNLISMAFAVLYVGLGLDYALYVAMRYIELRQGGLPHRAAVPNAAVDVGGFLFVCAATTSLGFLAFVPTSFTGIAGLGLISGAGMFISLIVSLSVLPALMVLLEPGAIAEPRVRPWLETLLELPYRHAQKIWLVMAGLIVIAAIFAPRARFDFDPLHLRDPKSESVATFRDLLHDPSIPTLTLSAIAKDDAAALAMQQRLAKRPTVARVVTIADLVPKDQEEKLTTLEELGFSIGPMLSGSGTLTVVSKPEDAAALDRLQDAMQQASKQWKGEQAKSALALATALKRLQEAPDSDARLAMLRNNLLAGLPAHLSQLKDLLSASAVTEASLPDWLRRRWRAVDGRPRVEVSPKEILDDNAATARFVDDVRAAEPNVSGGPLGMIEAGRAVVASFKQAFLFSAIAITLLLMVLLRSVKDTVLVLIPLLCAGLFTMAASVITGTPFNFANVIALPLLLGVGVDYGVYLVQQGRLLPADANLLKTGATRAVLFGALITIANFGDLMLAGHPGMVSMGLLLTIGLSLILFCTLVLLPGLLQRFRAGAAG